MTGLPICILIRALLRGRCIACARSRCYSCCCMYSFLPLRRFTCRYPYVVYNRGLRQYYASITGRKSKRFMCFGTITTTTAALVQESASCASYVCGLGPISGPHYVCQGSCVTLSDSQTGGVWSSSNTSIATVSGTGLTCGVSLGTAIISYSYGCLIQTYSVTVSKVPTASIGGSVSLCDADSTFV